jgi:hypothetical protein
VTCYDREVDVDLDGWSGDGAFTQVLIDALRGVDGVRLLKVEDAPASRADSAFSFISNELFVVFADRRPPLTLAGLQETFEARGEIGAPDYADEGMLQYLRTERIIPPYQTRGHKLIELVRIYEAGTVPRRA